MGKGSGAQRGSPSNNVIPLPHVTARGLPDLNVGAIGLVAFAFALPRRLPAFSGTPPVLLTLAERDIAGLQGGTDEAPCRWSASRGREVAKPSSPVNGGGTGE